MDDSRVNDPEFIKEVRRARARAAHSIRTKPHASSVRYDAPTRTVCIGLMNGASFSLPVDIIPGLEGASDADLSDVWVAHADPGVHWETLDVDFEIWALVKTVLDTGTLIRAAKPATKAAVAKVKGNQSKPSAKKSRTSAGRSRKSASARPVGPKRG